MRTVLLLITSVSMLAGLVGCEVTTGACDCVEMPPAIAAPVVPVPVAGHPATIPSPMPATLPPAKVLPMSATNDASPAPLESVPVSNAN
jgi:hypothetical protein